jgi:hypothetical protein
MRGTRKAYRGRCDACTSPAITAVTGRRQRWKILFSLSAPARPREGVTLEVRPSRMLR